MTSTLARAVRLAPLATLILMGCATGQPTAVTPESSSPAPVLVAGVTPATAMDGAVLFPQELASGGQVIPTGIGSNKSYRTLQAGQATGELPVPGATVTALDPATRQPAPVPPTTTDAQGRYRLDGLTPGETYLVQVVFQAADGSRTFRLLAIGRPGEATAVSWRSTAVAASLLQSPESTDLRRIDLTAARAAEAQRQAEWEALAPEARTTFLGGLLTVVTTPTTSTSGATEPLPLPIVSALPALPTSSSSPSALPVVGQVGEVVEGVTGALPIVGSSPLPSVLPSAVSSLLPVDPATVVSALPILGGGQTQTTPTPSPTPTPAPTATPSGLVSTVTGVLSDTTNTVLPQPTASPKPLLPGLF